MNVLYERFIEVLQEDIKKWEQAAIACDALIPDLAFESDKHVWRLRASQYRNQAESHRVLIETIRAEQVKS
jgi:hypothetical protein